MNSKNTTFKEYNLYVMRAHFQVQARQEILGNNLCSQKPKHAAELNTNIAKKEEFDVKEIERYKILLNFNNPNLHDLYSKITEVCPEFRSKTHFYLYWKNSASEILPISNYITYLSMVSLIGSKNNNLYLIARDWNDSWSNDITAIYTALPEDKLLVNMVAPKQSVFTATQEEQMQDVKAAAKTEFTTTYNIPGQDQKLSSRKKSNYSKLKK